MTKSTITDERITSVIERLEHFASNLKWTDVRGAQDLLTAADGLRELQERRKADSEPVAWTDTEELRDVNVDGIGYLFGIDREANKFADPRRQIMLYRHAQPAPERDQVRSEHAEWSQATFGNVGPIGPLKHLSKEALEAAAEPDDLSEWADMQFLLWDAQRRAGITDEQITQAMIEKLAVNKQREWPEPKDGEPRLHIKEQSAPVVQENSDPRDAFEAAFPMPKHAQRCGDGYAVTSYGAWTAYEFVKKWEGWNACRAAMLQEPQKSAGVSNNCRSNENVQVMQDVSRCSTKAAPALYSPTKTAESRGGNSPAIPDGYVMVPMRLTAENGAKAALIGEFNLEYTLTCHECFGEGYYDCSGEGAWINTILIDWTTIKEIWAKGVEHFAAAPQEVR